MSESFPSANDASPQEDWAKAIADAAASRRREAYAFVTRQQRRLARIMEQARRERDEMVEEAGGRQVAKREEERAAAARQIEQFKQRLAEATEQVAELTEQIESQRGAAQVTLGQARNDAEQLRKQLQQSRQQLHERAQTADSSGRGSDDLRRRFEMAVEDLREEKTRSAELEAKLAALGDRGGSATAGFPTDMNWEDLKKQMLAQLESQFDEDNPRDREDRLSIEGTMRITDDVVARKETEIVQLRRKLAEKRRGGGPSAEAARGESAGEPTTTGAAALAQILDADELVQEERANLKRLQEQWKDKLRQAEVDISLERAQLARQQAELEEKVSALPADDEAPDGGAAGPSEKKPTRGKWLARLGLADADE